MSFRPAPASIAPAQPVAASPAPVPKLPTSVKDYGKIDSYQVNSVSLNKVYSVDLNSETINDIKWPHVNNLVNDYDQSKNLFVMMGAYDDYWDRVALHIT